MKIEIKNLEDLKCFAKKLAPLLTEGDVISLIGDLGAGKTSLVQFIAKELEVEDYVTSPTFSIINIYEGKYELNHLDLYRLENEDELLQLDYESYFYPDGISFIEWAEKGGSYLPKEMIEICITKNLSDETRIIEIKDNSKRGIEIGSKL